MEKYKAEYEERLSKVEELTRDFIEFCIKGNNKMAKMLQKRIDGMCNGNPLLVAHVEATAYFEARKYGFYL